MKTQYYVASSLDGFIATEDHSLEWLLQFGSAGAGYDAFVAEVGALAMGAATYQWLLDHLARERAPWPYPQPAWVFSHRTLPRAEGADLRFAQGEVAPVHRAMAQAAAGRNLWIVGGGELAGQFHDAGLLDELIVQVVAVTLGAGRPLLPRRIATPPMRLLSATQVGQAWAELRLELPKPHAPAA